MRVPLPQAAGQVVKGGLVLGEDYQTLAVPEPALGAQQPFHQSHQGVEAGVGNGVLVGDRRAVEGETQAVEGFFDAADLLRDVVDEIPEPSPHDGCGRGMALLGFPVIPGFLPHSAFDGGQLRFGRCVLAVEALSCPVPGLGERGGAGEQPFAQDLHRESSGTSSPLRSRRSERAHRIAKSVEGDGKPGLAWIDIQGQGLRRMADAEPGRGALRVDVPFQSANDHVVHPPAHGRAHLAGAGEAHGVQHLQQAGEGAGVAVVGRGGEKQPVLELGRHQPEHLAEPAVFAEGGRHQVVALIDDQQVPGQMGRALRRAAGGQELLQHVRLAQVVIGGDDPAERAPRVGVHPQAAAQALGRRAVHDVEPERELLPEFFLPLPAQRGRGQDQDPSNTAPQEQLGEDQPGFDGLAQTDVVGQQQADARHAERLQQGDELVVLDADAAVERTRHRLAAGNAFAARVHVGRERCPARGAKERVEVFRTHGVGLSRVRQRSRFQEVPFGLQFPEQAFLSRGMLVLVFQVDQVDASVVAVEGFDGRDHAGPVADGGEHAGARDVASCGLGIHGSLRTRRFRAMREVLE